jgi:NAD(P)H-dependent flavin oxidoreductase YrpB (nitropropane dioxygenase family)
MESYLKATTRDTVRSKSYTGKPCRMLRNDWTDAWEGPDSPGTLGMPLQFMVTAEAVSRGHRYADKAQKVGFNPAGQVIGHLNEVRPVREVMNQLVNEYLEATAHLDELNAAAAAG